MSRKEASWVSYSTWKCSRHIPSSKIYPAMILRCPSCQQPRPDEDDRPSLLPIEEVPQTASPLPSLTLVAPPEPLKVVPEPVLTEDDGEEPELDEELSAPEEKTEPSKVDPVVPLPKKGRCPGPRCRKVSRSNSPYCSKICSDRCLRLRKKFAKTTLTDQEARWLNTILLTLGSWGWERDAGVR